MPTKKDNDDERRARIDELVARVKGKESGARGGNIAGKRRSPSKSRPKARKM